MLVTRIALAVLLPAALLAQDARSWMEAAGGKVQADARGRATGVDLTAAWVSDADIARLAALPELTRLTLARTRVSDAGLEPLKDLRNLVEFDCDYCESLTADGIAHMAGWQRLQRLNLRGSKVTSEVFPRLAKLTRLKSLDISFTQIDDDGFEELAALTQLEDLAIGGNRLTGPALDLVKLLPALRRLDVGGIQRVDSGVWGMALTNANLERLGSISGLRALSLSGANLADTATDRPGTFEPERAELRDLSGLASLSNLELLDLARTRVTSQSLEALRRLPRLRELNLSMAAGIDDAAAAVLASLKTLEVIHLTGSRAGNKTLDAIENLPRLKRLSLGGTSITLDRVTEFRQKHRNCQVSWWQNPS